MTNTEALQLKQWAEMVNQLCHEIFMQSEKGVHLLNLWEQRYFLAPTADPGLKAEYAFFNEGRNNFIRGIRLAAYAAIKPPEATTMKVDIEHQIDAEQV